MGNGTSIGKVRGLGAAHHGAHHWLVQRFTAVGNLVLMSWLLVSLVMLGDYGHASVTKWLSHPLNATAMILLVSLGITKIIEAGSKSPAGDGAQSTASAKAAGQGASAFAGAISVTPGVWVYQLTDDGLALELTAKGTKYYKDDALN